MAGYARLNVGEDEADAADDDGDEPSTLGILKEFCPSVVEQLDATEEGTLKDEAAQRKAEATSKRATTIATAGGATIGALEMRALDEAVEGHKKKSKKPGRPPASPGQTEAWALPSDERPTCVERLLRCLGLAAPMEPPRRVVSAAATDSAWDVEDECITAGV